DKVLQTFGGGQPWDFAYVATARGFFELKETTSLYVGLNYAHGKTSQTTTTGNTNLPMAAPGVPVPTNFDNWYDKLYGGAVSSRWNPPNKAPPYTWRAWTTEYWLRQIPSVQILGGKEPQLGGGMYPQLVLQGAPRWSLGARAELMGTPAGTNV